MLVVVVLKNTSVVTVSLTMTSVVGCAGLSMCASSAVSGQNVRNYYICGRHMKG